MAIYFKTSYPSLLLKEFKEAIDKGHITTWSYDADGDFTHTPPQWKNSAWLRPEAQVGRLALFILSPKDKKLSSETYAVYHGRFIESMVRHCDKSFTEGTATAMPEGKDKV